MILVVGLGNVGSRYAKTRHNIGFMIVDQLAAELGATWSDDSKLKAKVATAELDGEKVILAKPTTLMNGSGESVQRLIQFYKLAPGDIWAIFDDVDTDFGHARRRRSGSGGGHQGVNSLIRHVGSDFNRLRIGISLNDRAVEPSEVYVLKPFNRPEQEQLPELINAAAKVLREQLSAASSEDAGFRLLEQT